MCSTTSDDSSPDNNDIASHYIIHDIEILRDILLTIACCPKCNERVVHFRNNISQKKGLSNLLQLNCNACNWNYSCYTSKTVESEKPGHKSFDINARALIAFREIGRGYGAMEKACGIMNCAPPANMKPFIEMQKEISNSYCEIAEQTMIVPDDPYSGKPVEKLECIGHIQKRVGGRLRKLKQFCKEDLEDGKNLVVLGGCVIKTLISY